jgi:hypothetical protein
MKTVCIEMADDGSITVGLEPEEGDGQEGSAADESQDKSWMSPAKSLDEALSVAKDLLTSDQASDAQNNDAFEKGYQGVSGMGPLMEGGQ